MLVSDLFKVMTTTFLLIFMGATPAILCIVPRYFPIIKVFDALDRKYDVIFNVPMISLCIGVWLASGYLIGVVWNNWSKNASK